MRILDPNKGVGNFGRWLSYNIFCSGMTIEEFAKDIGLSKPTVSGHIRRKRRPSVTIVQMYCDYFGEGDMQRVYNALVDDWTKNGD